MRPGIRPEIRDAESARLTRLSGPMILGPLLQQTTYDKEAHHETLPRASQRQTRFQSPLTPAPCSDEQIHSITRSPGLSALQIH